MARMHENELREALQQAERCERSGERAGAIEALQRALALREDLQPVHVRLGILLQEVGEPAAAVAHLETATRLRPDDARAWNNLAAALNALGRSPDAERVSRQVLAIDPSHPWASYHLGRALAAQGRGDEARSAFESATRALPGNAMAWEALGTSWLEEGRLQRARAALIEATRLDPKRPSAWSRLASSHLHAGDIAKALEAMARAEALEPADASRIGSTRLLAMHYDSAISRDEIFREHRAWAKRYAPQRWPAAFSNDRRTDRRLRIGYVSPRFHGSALACLLEPVLAAHDAKEVEVICYATHATADDEVSRRIRSYAAGWVDASMLDDDALARRMRSDAVDVAVDLAGHAPGNRLLAFARGPAPVTATWLDYFDTTGLDAMGYLVTDGDHSPADDRQQFSEALLRLPRVRFAYAPPADAPAIRPRASSRGDSPVFASFNRSAKISAATLAAWAGALSRAPQSRLIVKNSSLAHPEEREALSRRFAESGIDPARVEFRGFSPHRDMLEEYNEVDVVLDTLPYNGGITTLEALWMGKPVVTMRGDTLISRQTAALLRAVDREEWVACDREGFASIAAGLVAEPARLDEIASGMRDRMRASPLLDARGLAQALEAAYRFMWRRHLEGSPSPGDPAATSRPI
ncbi:MAG: O-linked N-acetylglucosamine transferase, SPINDLY family protein [Usitatibacter sp.]